MKLIVMSSSTTIENETEVITHLFEAGLETFHLRKHRMTTRETRDFLRRIPAHFHNRIVLHTHHNLAAKFKLKGIHLTKSHKKKKYRTLLRLWQIRIRNPSLIITTSFSSIGNLFEAQRYQYSYVFLSPVFDSLSSKFQGGFTEHSLRSAVSKTVMPVVARGGVDINAIGKAHNIGFSGVALYSAIWKATDPVKEFNRIAEEFQKLSIPIE